MDIIAATPNSTEYVAAWPWSAGFGTKYTNPVTLPTGQSFGAAFQFDYDVAIAHSTSPYITTYPWSAGFGTKYANPGTALPGTGASVDFNDDDIAISTTSSPYVNVYPWSAGFGTKYSDPGTLPGGSSSSVVFGPNDIAVGHSNGARVAIYPWSAGFGTKYADASTALTSNVRGSTFGVSDWACVHGASPHIGVYPWSAGFGTKYSDPAGLPGGTFDSRNVVFDNNGSVDTDVIFTCHSDPTMIAYPWSAGFGTRYSNPSTTGAGFGVRLVGSDLFLSSSTSPYIHVFEWTSGVGFGTKYSDPGTAGPAALHALDVSNAPITILPRRYVKLLSILTRTVVNLIE
jgi:hypothetical protein